MFTQKTAVLTLGFLLFLIACKKQDTESITTIGDDLNPAVRSKGVLPDDPARLAKVPLIVSSEFVKLEVQAARKGGGGNAPATRDSDSDGIPDINDACSASPETYNGYMDSDGCPDTVPPPPPAGDATPPTINISAPANGSIVSGTVAITVNTSDNVGVRSVSYLVDGVAMDSSATPPFSVSWNTTTIGGGLHTLTARAYDAAGNSTASTISVTKDVTVLPPPVSLPYSIQLNMPPVGHQGSEGSCVAWAIGYYSRSAEAYYQTNAAGYTQGMNIFSPEFLFNQTKSNTDCGGSSVLSALDFLVQNGICTWQSMPYTSGSCSLMPTSVQQNEALNFRIRSYSTVLTSDITAIKTLLSQNHPLLLGVSTDQQFDNAGPGFIWSSYNSSATSLHEVTICGYDDARQAFKIVNSWGTGWGDAGYSWIAYDFLPKLNNYVFLLNL